ncbi:MAG: hypothetical protein ACHREM_26165 [Polyangiales bacterium]
MNRFHNCLSVRAVTVVLVMAMAVACGGLRHPVNLGARPFERCYRIDAEALVLERDKLACWTAWDAEFDRDADHERVAYARARVRALSEAAPTATEPSVGAATPAVHVEPTTRSLRGP